MKQGRKCRYTTAAALRYAFAAIAAVAMIAPAAAAGQAAAGEYDNLNLPNAGGRYDLPSGSASGNAVKQSGQAQGSGEKGDNAAVVAGSDSSSGGPGGDATSDGSDGGGAAVLLIVLAVIAAVCVGIAAWRLRRSGPGDDPGGDVAPTPQVNSGTTGETRSL